MDFRKATELFADPTSTASPSRSTSPRATTRRAARAARRWSGRRRRPIDGDHSTTQSTSPTARSATRTTAAASGSSTWSTTSVSRRRRAGPVLRQGRQAHHRVAQGLHPQDGAGGVRLARRLPEPLEGEPTASRPSSTSSQERGCLFEELAQTRRQGLRPVRSRLPRRLRPARRSPARSGPTNVRKRNVFTKYGDAARAVLDALLDKYADRAVERARGHRDSQGRAAARAWHARRDRQALRREGDQYLAAVARARHCPLRHPPDPGESPMSIGTTIKTIQDIMRKDAGVDGDAQRIGQLGWMLFLKIFDDRENETELDGRRLQVAAPAAPALAHLGRRGLPERHHRRRLLDFVEQRPSSRTLKDLPVDRRRTSACRAGRAQRLRGRLQLHEDRHADAPGHQQDQRHRLQRSRRPPHVRRHLRAAPQGPPDRRQRRRVLHAPRRHPVHRRHGQPAARRDRPRPRLRHRRLPHLRHRAHAQPGRRPPNELAELQAQHPRHREEAPAAPAVHDQPDAARHRRPVEDPPRQHARPAAARLRPEGSGGRDRHQPAVRRHGGGRHRDQLPRRVPHPRDRRPVPRARS